MIGNDLQRLLLNSFRPRDDLLGIKFKECYFERTPLILKSCISEPGTEGRPSTLAQQILPSQQLDVQWTQHCYIFGNRLVLVRMFGGEVPDCLDILG